MDETTREIIDLITTLYEKPTTLPSGHSARRYYRPLDLTTGDLARLAAAAAGHVSANEFDVAVATGLNSVFFAVEAAGGRHVGLLRDDATVFGAEIRGKKVALVDDVTCSGATLRKATENITRLGGHVVGYIVLVDRLSPSGTLDGRPVWSAIEDSLSEE